jgi:hypothetical protein
MLKNARQKRAFLFYLLTESWSKTYEVLKTSQVKNWSKFSDSVTST